MTASCDIIIIGAGVIGACTAYELAKKGWKTLTVDKAAAAGFGSTGNSCAIIRPYYSALETCAMAYESWFTWTDWAGYIGTPDPRGMATYNETGSIILKTEKNDCFVHILKFMDELGCPYEELTAAELRERLPIVDIRRFMPPKRIDDPAFGTASGGEILGAVFFPRSGYVSDPTLTAQNAEHAARRHGARFRYHCEVRAIRRAGGRVAGVDLADGSRIDAPVVVNVAGPHSAKVNRMAGVYDAMKMKTRALRHEVAHVPSPPGFDFEADGMVYSDSEIGTYCRPEIGNHILIGSEDPDCDSHDWVDPDDFDRDFTEQARIQAMRLAQRFPAMGIASRMKGVVDLYDVTEDWIPIYDRTDLDGFYVAIGTSGNQFKNAPVAAKMMAHLIEACENGAPHDADPVRFHLDHLDREVSIGFYSRNRAVNPNSSFSVLG